MEHVVYKTLKESLSKKASTTCIGSGGGGGSCPPAPVNKISYFRV